LFVNTRLLPTLESLQESTYYPYTISDDRPFFEREGPQLNLLQQISYSSDEDLFHHLRSLWLVKLACARNVETYIGKFENHIEPIVDLFHSSLRILILESDSKDKTLEKLYKWSRVQVYKHSYIVRSITRRSQHISYCRNKLLNKARELTFDCIFAVDFDVFTNNIFDFVSNFRYNTDGWSVMIASANYGYYDVWA